MLQVRNATPFTPGLFVFPNPRGIDTLYVVAKATFSISEKGLRVAEKQQPLKHADEYWAKPGESSLKYASEAHLGKPATDLALVGNAYAPNGRPSTKFGVSISIGAFRKIIHVHGDRTWRGNAFGLAPSSAEPVVEVPLVYERSFGGEHDLRNPVGCGFRGKKPIEEMKGAPVPNLEDPKHPVRSPSDRISPVGVGYIAPFWKPRSSFAGTYDEVWQKTRAPFLPLDFDLRFFQSAHPDFVYPGVLKGGEPVELINVSEVGVHKFNLPICELQANVVVGGEHFQPEMHLETLLLEPSESRFSMMWRGAMECDKRALKIQQVGLDLKSLEGVFSK